ncbi:MAG: hypothetical protein V7636_2291 [Actinomycetota bacterium]|jgi:MOSC domain-containing protein YiiM
MLRDVDDSHEVCSECGFDSSRWRVGDAITHLSALGWWWRTALDGLDQAEVAQRPAPAVWSALEYGVHSAFVTAVLRGALERVLAGGAWEASDRINPAPAHASSDDGPLLVDCASLLVDLEREGAKLATVAQHADTDHWSRCSERPGRAPVRADSILFHAVHDASHHQMDVGRCLSSIGSGAVRAAGGRSGRVAQINTSAGGVPKLGVDHVDIASDGLVGDRQADDAHHGRPFQAVCLWTTDAITDLVAAGHGVVPGSVGENLTVDGLDWTALRPGARLRVGSSLLELSFPAIPCKKQAQWFSDGDFSRLAFENNPRWARWYAWVRESGSVMTDDQVLIV